MSDKQPASLRARMEEMRARGFRPTKTRGQNFLCDPNALAAIVRDAKVGSGDRVLEIGVGLGFLTEALLASGAEVTALEIDADLLAFAAEFLGDRATLVLGDALASKNQLGPELLAALPESGPWHLVANLPYSISGPLLVLLARAANPPQTMTVLVQRELGLRVVAPAADEMRGALGARLELTYKGSLGRAVGAQLFWPRPRVASCIVRLEQVRDLPADLVETFDRLVGDLFQRRRKTLRASLGALVGGGPQAEVLLVQAGIDPKRRVEELDRLELEALARAATGALKA